MKTVQEALNKTHEHFETWARTCDGNCSRLDLRRNSDGNYVDPLVARDFLVWNAARSQPPAVQEPVAFVSKEGDRLVGILRQELPVGTDLYLRAPSPAEQK